MIEFKEIDRHNFLDVIDLRVAEEQKSFVAPNVFSLAQAKAFPECICLAIYQDDVLVGFTMYCMDSDDKEYWIYRLMIDAKHQSKGYGKEAMEKLIERIKQDQEHKVIYLSFEPENNLAKGLYEKLGFEADGRIIDGEIVYKLTY
ncbi:MULTISPECIES: GNAT family N-acetyltransferase [Cytobacillus]|uniref:Spermidine acetyltransferase n=1 Tax=Cytobacillus oceanisediminis 2691 TaxID=1196031 RepID=A0A160MHD5_9BACI|nr:GNAT family N-acetyltransferase [Cytobacillus oceanisediminis]AND42859.1 spermidine acetyltransferase [Cytobacillus oceanisediminis 2691]MCM3243774.1 GNAT family N-acetyltransferase [Cytobacillus oceanisediminis]MCS0825563.1 GNAT family N-acetyltransferase [Cytobacillus firmus]USK44333.1 GNAT family N-acetyltransferase [Cytobacillus oceanisediminis]